MLRVGLTGSIATGKSFVSGVLAGLGCRVVDAALMIESGGYRRFDKLIVVHCRPEAQLERLMRRNQLSREEAERRIAAQMPQEEKLRYADFSVDTSGSFEEARARTEEVFKALRKIADEEAASH